ncbi:MAG: hypothetical protein NTX28_05070 [Novosphingobium sp.]|nr:hypothetical protein [Novosphingobium sp.]
MATTAPRAGLTMGHIALHYARPDDGPLAARLLAQMGLVESQMLPLPGGNFYRFVVSPDHVARGDGIVFLSCLPEPQARLIAAMRTALGVGTGEEHPAVSAYRAMMAQDFEASFHFALLVDSLEDLEAMVLNLQHLAADDPDLKGRITIGMNRARPGDAAIDARLDASPVFATVTRHAYGGGGVQVFVETDLVCAGQLGESMVFEFDYVFPGTPRHILSAVEI